MLRKGRLLSKAAALTLCACLLLAGLGIGSNSALAEGEEREMVGNVYKEGYPIVKEPVTLTTVVSASVYTTGNVADVEMWKIMEEETGVHIEILEQIPSTDYSDKVNLMINGGTIPDIFLTSIDEITTKYYNSGLFAPLDDLIAEYSPSYSAILEDPVIRANMLANDGHIYSTPFYEVAPWLDVMYYPFINTEWLDTLGLEMPTNLDEFYDVLVAFRDKDPNGNGLQDEIPFSYYDNMITYFFSEFDLPINTNYEMLDGKTFVFGPQRDEFRTGLEYLHKLYADGLLDAEAMSQGIAEMQAKGSGEYQLLGSFIGFWADDYTKGEETYKYDAVPPFSTKWISNVNLPTRGGMSISAQCENKEVAMRWADYINQTPYHAYWCNFGPDSVGVMTTTEDGKMLQNSDAAPEGITFEEWTRQVTLRDMIPYCILPEGVIEAREVDLNPQRKLEYNAKYTDILVPALTNAHTSYYESEDVQQEALTIQTDLGTIVDNFLAESIMNGVTDESWSSFQSTLEKAKVDRFIEIRQKSLDHYFELVGE